MLKVAGAILGLALYIWFIVDVVRSQGPTRTLPKGVWLLIVILLPLLGGVIWLLAGRPRLGGAGRRRRGQVAPDDDPAFLRKIGDNAWSERMRRRREGDDAAPAS